MEFVKYFLKAQLGKLLFLTLSWIVEKPVGKLIFFFWEWDGLILILFFWCRSCSSHTFSGWAKYEHLLRAKPRYSLRGQITMHLFCLNLPKCHDPAWQNMFKVTYEFLECVKRRLWLWAFFPLNLAFEHSQEFLIYPRPLLFHIYCPFDRALLVIFLFIMGSALFLTSHFYPSLLAKTSSAILSFKSNFYVYLLFSWFDLK